MELKNIVLHQITREENEIPILNCSDHLLEIKDLTVIDFVQKLIKSFGAKRPTYGSFEKDVTTYPFQELAKNYLSNGDFLDFSTHAMKLLERDIQVPKAKGGYVVFTHYEQHSTDFLITIMLDKSEQFAINDDSLDIQKLLTLDIDRLARANRINITKWLNEDELYLGFIKGTRDVSKYFQKFIGNTDLTSSKINATNLKAALSKYMREEGFNHDQKEVVNRQIGAYFERQYNSESDIELMAIAAHINQDSPQKFLDFVHDNPNIQVSGNFRVTRKSDFDFFHRSVVSGSGFKLEFEKNLVKTRKIIRDGNDVIIKNLPQDILDSEFES